MKLQFSSGIASRENVGTNKLGRVEDRFMQREMIAAVFHGVNEGLKLEIVTVPEIKDATDVLIKVHRCGICGSDLATLEGRNPVSPPVILGHELGGEVVEVGKNVRQLKIGDHVSMLPDLSCGICRQCRSNRRNLCQNMTSIGEQLNGALAEYLVAPEGAIYKVPDEIPWDNVPIAEPLACAVNGVAKTNLQPGESAAVFGAGPMGLLWLCLLRRRGAGTLISVEPTERRAQTALKVGADHVINPTNIDPVAEISRLTDGKGADVVAELVGRPEAVELAVKSAAYGGRIIVMSTCRPDSTATFKPYDLMRYERSILGTYISNGNFQIAIEALRRGFIPTEIIISHRLPIREIHHAMELNRRGESVKTLILPNPG